MALLSYALTTVARVKTFMGISVATYDTVLEYMVNSVTDFIENYCDRRFKETTYTNEEYDGNGTKKLLLKQYPVDTAGTLTLAQRDSIDNNSSWTTIDSEDYFVKANGLIEYANGFFHKYPLHYRMTYTAGYDYDNAASYLSDVGAGDLEWACWELVRNAFENRKTPDNVKSESLADYSITYMDITMTNGRIKEVLDKYKRPYGNR